MKQQWPNITIMIVTYNNERTLEECLKRIVFQEYPTANIEYLIIDGGSTDHTKAIGRKYGFTIIESEIPHDAEAQRGIGLKKAKSNLIVSLDADNFLPTKFWLQQMIQPFLDDSTLVHAHTMYYGYRPSDSIFNRYVGLFGMADPVVFYVGRPDRLPRFIKQWTSGKIVKETRTYYLVDFSLENLPTVGCNGVVYRKDLLLEHAKATPKDFLHIDVFADLVSQGFTRFAIVKIDMIHHTAVTISRLIEKRLAFLDTYYLAPVKRRYLIYNPRKWTDRVKLMLFVLYTLTFIKPFLDSLRGYLVIRDPAWFVHPIVCWIYLYTYGLAAAKKLIRS